MKMTFRWYGNSDPISLEYIRQIPGCSGIMAMMDDFKAGEVWDKEIFKAFVEKVNAAGLEVEVIESINVHEDIKMGLDTRDQYIENYKQSIRNVAECGVKMAVHPDDPAWPVFGIPRITHTLEQLEKIVNLVDSPSNTLCLCTGSLGSDPNNNLPEIIREFGKRNKIGCAHVRNIKFLGERNFYESSHLTSAGSLDMFEIMKAFHNTGFDGYIRPDHGRMIWGEKGRSGYGLYDRALGLTYLNGLWEALEKLNK